jgi:hypothetical protein
MPDKFWDWAPKARRYRDPITGRFVSRDTIRRGVDDLIADSQKVITEASEALRSGTIDLAEWQLVMREEIKRTQLGAQALLRGGWKQLTKDDYSKIADRIREQYEYLHNFTTELREGRVRTDGTFMNRARLYPASARVGYHEDESELVRESGYREELNVLHPAEHCADCVYASGLGWVPIGTNPPIGRRKCLGNDRCTMRYR